MSVTKYMSKLLPETSLTQVGEKRSDIFTLLYFTKKKKKKPDELGLTEESEKEKYLKVLWLF